jgi:DNA processing protein
VEIKEITEIPQRLKNVYDPPKKLYVVGNEKLLFENKIVAIVGTRQITDNGYEITAKIAKQFVKEGYIIVSGMALGVDRVAHEAAIEAGGKTIAVLGAGVDIIYPPQHKHLYFNIIQSGGAIISEIPPGHFVPREKFAARNRIISGLSEAVVITQANIRSGSMITAKLALDQGKDVYCVPGSEGCDYLLSQGANDILNEWI